MANIDVWTNKQIIGRLSKSAERHVFSYGLNSSEALSLTMPIRTESYNSEALHPIFQMNLPEGYLRQAIENATIKQYGSDDLTMLAILGRSQIGRLGYAIADEPLVTLEDDLPALDSLLNSNDAQLFNQLLHRFAMSSGVAGVQPKVLVDIKNDHTQIDTKATLPFRSYIVKSWGNEYPHLGCNEYFCLTLAKNAGLEVPDFHLSDNGKLLIIKRFDIDEHNNSLGFEDFCVLQGKGTKEKYDASLESCTNTIREYVSPDFQQQALDSFFKLTLINILIRNGDAHLKNSGVIYQSLQDYRLGDLYTQSRQLAPIFDIISTTPYIPNDTMALSLTGSKRWPKWKVLEKFAMQHCNIKKTKANDILQEVVEAGQNTLFLLTNLANKHQVFAPIAEQIAALIEAKI